MDKERIAGAAQKAIGSVKKAIGKATGRKSLETEGHADKTESRVRWAVGKVKDAAREIAGRRGSSP